MVERASVAEWLYPGEVELQHWGANFNDLNIASANLDWEYRGVLFVFTSGGHLTLTNYRLLYQTAHQPNLQTGRFSTFLPTILQVFPVVRVATSFADYFFNTFHGQELVEATHRAKAALTPSDLEALRAAVRADPDKAGAGTHAFWKKDLQGVSAEDLEHLAQWVRNDPGDTKARVVQGERPMSVFGLLNAVELLHPELFPARVL